MRGESLVLHGCAPTPLASYLKALGVLRLISSPANHVSGEAADAQARGWWEDERFHLRTTLSRERLLHFFLDDYAPSPIIAPWNGRAGFLEGDAGETSTRRGAVLTKAIEKSTCRRLESIRLTVGSLRRNNRLDEYNRLRAKVKALQTASTRLAGDEKKANDTEKRRVEKQVRVVKSLLLPSIRAESDPHHVSYIDACYVLAAAEVAAPILGSGGNDGSRDFGVNFAEVLLKLFDFSDGTSTDRAAGEINSAVFDVGCLTDAKGSMGQFTPGKSGPNSTTGYDGSNPMNSWDVVLAMEGTLAFAGALTRRWGATGGSRAAFPFTFEPSTSGMGGLSSEDPNRPRGEIWTPQWRKPATFAEVGAIFAEGRLTLGQRTARTGLDAARSVARMGFSRGISGFDRYSIIQPDGKMPYQATPLGRFNTPNQPRRDLINDLEAGDWLRRVRRLASNSKKAPARARHAMRRLEDALFQMTTANRAREGTQNALMALGGLVEWLATSKNARTDSTPPPRISRAWILKADDKSPEFRIAAALAGIGLPAPKLARESAPVVATNGSDEAPTRSGGGSTRDNARFNTGPRIAPPMAAHLAPLDEKRFFHQGCLSQYRAWSAGDPPPTMVWGAGGLVPNLIAVLERRLVEASIQKLEDKPLTGAVFARLADVAEFLSGNFDDARCAALLAGLAWARPVRLRSAQSPSSGASAVPFAYAALKPVFTPDATLHAVGALREHTRMPVPPGLVAHLRTGADSRDGRATDAAVRSALARARASGLPSPFDPARSRTRGTGADGGRIGAGVAADRLAAALLIPIGNIALTTLLKRAFPGALPEDDNLTTEDITHAR